MPLNKQEVMEAVIMRFFKHAPDAMYDIGIGPKTEWRTIKNCYPQMVLCGCEPLYDLYPSISEFPGRVERVAIGNGTHCEINFNRERLLCATMRSKADGDETRAVPVWTLDQFDLKMGRLNNVVLWMDIEGMELEALRTGLKLLQSKRVKWINLEEHLRDNRSWYDPAEMGKLLKSYGYVRALEYNKHPAHQDVIYTFPNYL